MDRQGGTGGSAGEDRQAYLQTPSGTVLCDDAGVGGVDARSDEPGQVFVLNISHLDNKPQRRNVHQYCLETFLLYKYVNVQMFRISLRYRRRFNVTNVKLKMLRQPVTH